MDPSRALHGSHGSGMSEPSFGMCPGTRENHVVIPRVLKNGQIDQAVRNAVAYALKVPNLTNTRDAKLILNNKTSEKLREECGKVLRKYFQEYRHMGATCDFGGVAILM